MTYRIRHIDKRIGLVAVHEDGRDKDYRFYAGRFSVSYSIDRKKKNERRVQMHRTLDPNGAKASKIRAILEAAE